MKLAKNAVGYVKVVNDRMVLRVAKKDFVKGEEKLKNLEDKIEVLQDKAGAVLLTDEYARLTSQEKDEVVLRLVNNLPGTLQLLGKKRMLTRSDAECKCVQNCAATRDAAIEEAAINAMCGIGVGLATCLGTLGFDSVLGLVNAFLAAYAGDVAIQNAYEAYDRCVKECK